MLFTTPPIIQQSLPSARIATTPSSGGAYAPVNVKLWDSEGNASQVSLQYQNPPGTGTWTSATLLTIDGQPAATNPLLAAPSSGAMHSLVWIASQDLGGSFTGGLLLRARAADLSGTGAWSEPMFYTIDPNAYYATWAAVHGVTGADSGAAQDFDHDGAINLQEMAFGTDPTMTTTGVIIVNPPAIVQRGLPTTRVETANGFEFRALFGRRKDSLVAGLTYTVQFSADMLAWQSSTATPTVIADDAEIEAVTVPYPLFINGKKARFFRVQVTGP